MRSKKRYINGYEILVKNTKKYSTIIIDFLFELPYTRENIFLGDLLSEYILYANSKYKTREEINKRILELYSLGLGLNSFNIGEKMFIEARITLYDPELVKEDYMYEALEFIRDIIFKPNFNNNQLDKVELNRAKSTLIERVKYDFSDSLGQTHLSILETLYPDTYMMIETVKSESEYRDILDSFTDKKIIDFHKEVLNSLVSVTMMGNIQEKYYDMIQKLFKFDKVNELDTNYNERIFINGDTPYYTKLSNPNYKESILSVFYCADSKNDKDYCIYCVIERMLNAGGMILHKVLREELKLVYGTSCSYSFNRNNIMFRAFLDKSNEQKVQDGFDKAIERLKDAELVGKLLDKVKEEMELSDYIYDENKNNVWAGLINEHYHFNILWKNKLKIINSLTVNDILEGIEKLEKVKVHFFEGVA